MMNKLNNYKYLLVSLLMAFSVSFASCSDDKDEVAPIDNGDKKEVFINRLTVIYEDMVKTHDEAVFGLLAGEYPESSRALIDKEINNLKDFIDGLKDGSRSLLASDMDGIISQANTVKAEFVSSVRTEDYVAEPAELFVNGKNGGRGHINFGVHQEYGSFGEIGKQAFTVELWAKMKDVEGFYFLVSTFTDNSTDHERKGWNINNHHGNLRMTYGMGFNDLFEPAFGFSRTNEWVHIAMVTDEQGVDGDKNGDGKPIMIKMYLNGEEVHRETSNQNGKYYSKALSSTSMVAFTGMETTGSLAPDKWASGSIKHFHIWKKAKSQAQIQYIKDNPETVTGEESDLVCGWAFSTIPPDSQNIKDLTGKFTARINGDFTWTKY